MSLHPSQGARYLFERSSPGLNPESADYGVKVYTPEQCFSTTVTVHKSGDAEFQGSPEESALLPPDLVATRDKLARALARNAALRQQQGLRPWPAKLLKWRGPGRGS